jgi:osmoprotectant transport system ATP-binding protein
LESPVTLSPGLPLADARAALAGVGAGAVVDAGGRFLGQLLAAEAGGEGTVEERCRPAAAVGAGASLKDVTSALLLSDAGWVAVVDGDRLLGILTPESVHAAARRAASTLPTHG